MAANKRRQDEKHLKMLREMVTLAHNKQCFDCHQRGPTYVNMTIGSFVCTSCSGILRGLNPPHRVKSISMTSFTPEEMEFLKSRGNDFCRKVWLGLYDSRTYTDVDSKDESKIRDFMAQKYEKKRWYVAPTEAMHEEARKQNTPVAKTDNKPQKSLGNHMPAIPTSQLQSAKPVGGPAPVQAVQRPHTGGVSASPVNPAAVTSPTTNQAPPPKSSSGLNLLDDLGGDPFAGPAGNVSNNSTSSSGDFANFANFNSMSTQQPASTPQSAFPTQDFSGGGVLQPNSGAVATSSSAGFATNFTAQTSSATTTPSGDKYAALADLDSVFGSSVFGGTSTAAPVPANVFGGAPTQVSAGNGSVGWNGTTAPSVAPAGGPIPWGNMPVSSAPSTGAGLPAGQTTTVAGYAPPASNPFGAQVTSSVGNPFMSQATPSVAGFGQFGQPPVPAGPGFGAPVYATTTSTAAPPGGQFGAVQNGGWGYPAAPQGSYPAAPQGAYPTAPTGPYPGAMPPTYAAATMSGYAAKPPQATPAPPGYGGVMPPAQGQFAGWPGQQPPAGNPFMAGASQQPVPPRSNSTNPFL